MIRSNLGCAARDFLRDRDGGTTILFAGGLMMLVGLGAAAVDLSYLFVLRSKLQATADSAALAAGPEMDDEDTARKLALDYAGKNMPAANHGTVLAGPDVETGVWNFRDTIFAANKTPVSALRTIARRGGQNGNAAELFFAQAMGFDTANVEAAAVVARITMHPPCIMALEPTAGQAMKVNNGTAIAKDCGFHVNSNAPNALDIANNGTLEAESVCVRGGVTGAGNSDPPPQTPCPQLSDPLASMSPPSYGPCDHNNLSFSNGQHVLDPGVYCGGIKLSGSATVEFNPGEYIVSGGSMSVTGNSAGMEGEEVMFYFTDDAVLDLAGQGDIDLSAPTSGDYKGILFYGDPDADPALKHGVSGGSSMTYDGVMYFPANEVNATGNGTGSTSAGNTVLIARLLKFSGNGSMTFKFDSMAAVPLPDDLAAMNTEVVHVLVN